MLKAILKGGTLIGQARMNWEIEPFAAHGHVAAALG